MGEERTTPMTLEEAREKYLLERDKRLRPDGNAQYQPLEGEHESFDRDPWIDPEATRDPVVTETTVVIVGGGFAGMLTAIGLVRQGIRDFRIVEKGGDFGGTWYWNRYPGCMCDVESYVYMPLLEETGYMPTEKYASAPEIFEHCQRIARRFDLYPHALFSAVIEEAVWDETAGRWKLTTSAGDRLTTKYFVAAGGLLHKAKLPAIPGIADFAGDAFHTSRWRYDVTGGSPTEPMEGLRGKRVGIIGTGATAIQVIPQLAKTAEHLYVFQRTPSAVAVRNNGPTDEEWYRSQEPGWQARRIENFTHCVTGVQPEVDLVDDGWTELMWRDARMAVDTEDERLGLEREDFALMEKIRRRVDEVVIDPQTAESLKPWYGKHCKRICFHDDYLPTFNRDNVTLVDTDGRGVERITSDAVVVAGDEYPVDVLVFASGFEVTTDLHQRIGFDPVGRGGVRMSERWSDGAHTLHGVLSKDFPNMALIGIVQAGFGVNFVHFLTKSAEHVSSLIAMCEERGIATIEPTVEAEEEWLMVLYGVLGNVAGYNEHCTPGYMNSEQVIGMKSARNLVYLGSLLDYAGYLERWRDEAATTGEFAGTEVTVEPA